jgi:hypothetical protein
MPRERRGPGLSLCLRAGLVALLAAAGGCAGGLLAAWVTAPLDWTITTSASGRKIVVVYVLLDEADVYLVFAGLAAGALLGAATAAEASRATLSGVGWWARFGVMLAGAGLCGYLAVLRLTPYWAVSTIHRTPGLVESIGIVLGAMLGWLAGALLGRCLRRRGR